MTKKMRRSISVILSLFSLRVWCLWGNCIMVVQNIKIHNKQKNRVFWSHQKGIWANRKGSVIPYNEFNLVHDNLIVHRDLKPQNILLDGQLNVKLIDFGRAVMMESSEHRLRGSEGTYHFMAPEMLSEVFPEGYDGRQCDMWSLGVTFYGILFQTLPFY